jgi:hypothetical protein
VSRHDTRFVDLGAWIADMESEPDAPVRRHLDARRTAVRFMRHPAMRAEDFVNPNAPIRDIETYVLNGYPMAWRINASHKVHAVVFAASEADAQRAFVGLVLFGGLVQADSDGWCYSHDECLADREMARACWEYRGRLRADIACPRSSEAT